MIQIYPANSRHKVQTEWLRSYPSFSFGEYFDPDNTSFGVMRVCNDDTIAPSKGFSAHPHSDIEIVTLVLSGQLRHEDGLGNAWVSSAGELQLITAGSGIIQAAYNPSDTEEAHVLQLWFAPERKGLTPSREKVSPDREAMKNALLPVVTPDGREGTAKIHQDMTIYLTRMDAGKSVYFKQEPGRRIFLFAIEGKMTVNRHEISAGDTIRAEFEPDLKIRTGETDSGYVMLIDLP